MVKVQLDSCALYVYKKMYVAVLSLVDRLDRVSKVVTVLRNT